MRTASSAKLLPPSSLLPRQVSRLRQAVVWKEKIQFGRFGADLEATRIIELNLQHEYLKFDRRQSLPAAVLVPVTKAVHTLINRQMSQW